MNGWDSNNLEDLHTYITSGGWENRRSGRGIKDIYSTRILIEMVLVPLDCLAFMKKMS